MQFRVKGPPGELFWSGLRCPLDAWSQITCAALIATQSWSLDLPVRGGPSPHQRRCFQPAVYAGPHPGCSTQPSGIVGSISLFGGVAGEASQRLRSALQKNEKRLKSPRQTSLPQLPPARRLDSTKKNENFLIFSSPGTRSHLQDGFVRDRHDVSSKPSSRMRGIPGEFPAFFSIFSSCPR